MNFRRVPRQVGMRCTGCVIALMIAGAVPALAATDEPTVAPQIVPAESEHLQSGGDGRRTIGRLPANLGRTLVGVFNKDNLMPLVGGGAATAVSSIWDDDVRDSVSNPDSGFGKSLEKAGGWPSAVLVTGLFTAGRFAQGQRFRAMTYDLLDASIINVAYTSLFKAVVKRERPDGSNNQSFPSGHASNAFTLAAVAERHYGWKVGVPAYAVAAAMGYSRVVRDKHYLSDVVAGATLGYIVGRTVVRVNGRAMDPAGAKTTLNLSPIVSRSVRGLQVSLVF